MVSRGKVVVLTTKMALVGVGARARALFSLSDYVFAMKVQHKHMTPEVAYDYVRVKQA